MAEIRNHSYRRQVVAPAVVDDDDDDDVGDDDAVAAVHDAPADSQNAHLPLLHLLQRNSSFLPPEGKNSERRAAAQSMKLN